MFSTKLTVRLEHTDAAGVLYFAEGLKLCHQAYETFLDDNALPVRHILTESDWALPIVHAVVSLQKPVFVGDTLAIELQLRERGATSFTLAYRATRGDDSVFEGLTVHVVIDKTAGTPRELPSELTAILGEPVQST